MVDLSIISYVSLPVGNGLPISDLGIALDDPYRWDLHGLYVVI